MEKEWEIIKQLVDVMKSNNIFFPSDGTEETYRNCQNMFRQFIVKEKVSASRPAESTFVNVCLEYLCSQNPHLRTDKRFKYCGRFGSTSNSVSQSRQNLLVLIKESQSN